MLSDQEMLAIFRSDESDRVERKESVTNGDRIRQAICAFANDLPNHNLPGVLIVGQRDDLSCAGLQVDDALLLRLAAFRDDGQILPFPTMHVRRMVLDGCEVAVIEVLPSDNPPVRFETRIWIRVGPRRALATAEEERRLVEKRVAGSLPIDARPIRGSTLADLDLARFELEYLPAAISPEARAENRRPTDMQLQALRLVDPSGTPTATAILVLGVEPRRWFPGAYIQFLRVAGTELTGPLIDQRELTGTVIDQVRQMDDLIRLHIARAAAVGGPTRVDHVDYPDEALRQFVRNALLHRRYEGTAAPMRVTWFDDRVEIQSPGGPYGHVTKTNFGRPGITDYRNPTLAEALKATGFIERFGIGIALARQRLQANGNPPPEFIIEDEYLGVIVRRSP